MAQLKDLNPGDEFWLTRSPCKNILIKTKTETLRSGKIKCCGVPPGKMYGFWFNGLEEVTAVPKLPSPFKKWLCRFTGKKAKATFYSFKK